MKLKAIIKGLKNFVFEDEQAEQLARQRAKICGDCPHAKKMTYEIIKDNRIKELSRYCCELCGCPLSTLLRQSDKHCEINKW